MDDSSLLGFHQVLPLKMVFKFTGCCITLLLNFLYLCHQLLMLLSMLLLLPISENNRKVKSTYLW
jgi:hypothetical protein